MGLLDDLLAGATSGGLGGMGGRAQSGSGATAGAGALAALLPVVVAMLASRGSQRSGTGAGMGGGGLGDLLGQALGTGHGGGGLGDILGQVLGGSGASGAGGLGGLLEKLNQGGYASHAQSWVGTGQNMSISAGAIQDVFGQNGLAAIARQAGLSESETSAGLAQLLPEVVNHVTPQGRVPEHGELEATLEGLLRKLAR